MSHIQTSSAAILRLLHFTLVVARCLCCREQLLSMRTALSLLQPIFNLQFTTIMKNSDSYGARYMSPQMQGSSQHAHYQLASATHQVKVGHHDHQASNPNASRYRTLCGLMHVATACQTIGYLEIALMVMSSAVAVYTHRVNSEYNFNQKYINYVSSEDLPPTSHLDEQLSYGVHVHLLAMVILITCVRRKQTTI